MVIGIGLNAQARPACWPSDNAVNHRVTLDLSTSLEIPVKDVGYPASESRTVLKADLVKDGYELAMEFRETFDPLGHPQNVYALMVLNDDGYPIFFEDFTGGCKGPGLSFFPKQRLDLLFLKSKAIKGNRVHILLWSQ